MADQAPYITIHLGGALTEKYGRSHKLRAWSVGEALQGLAFNIPALQAEMMAEDSAYQVLSLRENEPLEAEELRSCVNVLVVPAIAGEGGNTTRGIIGGVLIIAGFFTGGATTVLGISLLGGAILNALSPKQKQKNSDEEIKRSDIFNESTSAIDSDACPKAYGRVKIRGQVLSQNISVSDI